MPFYGKVWSHGERKRSQIALTFDDGPNEPYTSQVLSVLSQYGIKATFFVIGKNVQRYPEVCQQVLAAGNVIGNHSYYHRRSLSLKVGRAGAREIELTHQAIYQATGYQPKLFRPPYGIRTPWFVHAVHRLGYMVVTWDVMTDDWKEDRPARDIVGAIVEKVRPGSIIVLHDGRGTREDYDRSQMLIALPEVIKTLIQRGFDFITLPELLGLESGNS